MDDKPDNAWLLTGPANSLHVKGALLSLPVVNISGKTLIWRSVLITKGRCDVIFIACKRNPVRHTLPVWRQRRIGSCLTGLQGTTA